jgi:hypothetical protein
MTVYTKKLYLMAYSESVGISEKDQRNQKLLQVEKNPHASYCIFYLSPTVA